MAASAPDLITFSPAAAHTTSTPAPSAAAPTAAVTTGTDTESPLVVIGRSLSTRVAQLMADAASPLPRWRREDEAGKEISAHVAQALEQQREINRANMRFHGLNYALNVANGLANKRLQERVAAEAGRTALLETSLSECTATIESLNTSLAHLEDETEEHRDTSARLEHELRMHTALLEQTRRQHEADRVRHARELAVQRALIARLHSRKIRQDAVVDAALGAVAVTAVNTALVEFPLALVLVLVPRSRLRTWLRQALKASAAVAIARYLRAWAQAIGWHQSIGALVPYACELARAGKGVVNGAAPFLLGSGGGGCGAADGDGNGVATLSNGDGDNGDDGHDDDGLLSLHADVGGDAIDVEAGAVAAPDDGATDDEDDDNNGGARDPLAPTAVHDAE